MLKRMGRVNYILGVVVSRNLGLRIAVVDTKIKEYVYLFSR